MHRRNTDTYDFGQRAHGWRARVARRSVMNEPEDNVAVLFKF
jgi:hypothetical protein